MKSDLLDKLLFEFCRKKRQESLNHTATEMIDYYLLSKYLEGTATAEEREQIEVLKDSDPDIAELLTPLEQAVKVSNQAVSAGNNPLPPIRSPWIFRPVLKAACFVVAIIGLGIGLYYSCNSDDKMVFRGIEKSSLHAITNGAPCHTNKTESITVDVSD